MFGSIFKILWRMDREQNIERFVNLLKRSRRGNLKIYIGMIAGVGKSYRMLQDAHELIRNGIDVQIGFIETHERPETAALIEGLSVIPRKKLFYKGKELEEMDLQSILTIHPEVVIVDELAHTNVEGSIHSKRWQDVLDILDAGISVITAVNIQHLEGISEIVSDIAGFEIKERVPDSLLADADEVVNIDLTADELLTRLKSGKIYKQDKIHHALANFFKPETILQLRELALKEVVLRVEKKVISTIPVNSGIRHEKFLACISSHEKTPRKVIHKVARLATRFNASFVVLYVQTPKEHPDKIPLANQRYLSNHFKLATELGGEVIQIKSSHVSKGIIKACEENQITTVCIGKPELGFISLLYSLFIYRWFVNRLYKFNIDLIVLT